MGTLKDLCRVATVSAAAVLVPAAAMAQNTSAAAPRAVADPEFGVLLAVAELRDALQLTSATPVDQYDAALQTAVGGLRAAYRRHATPTPIPVTISVVSLSEADATATIVAYVHGRIESRAPVRILLKRDSAGWWHVVGHEGLVQRLQMIAKQVERGHA